jgi:hypothetical protein
VGDRLARTIELLNHEVEPAERVLLERPQLVLELRSRNVWG